MNTVIQMMVATVLKMIWTKTVQAVWEKAIKPTWVKLRKKIARALLRRLLPGYNGARCDCGDAEKADQDQDTQKIEVQVKVGDQVVKVEVSSDEREGHRDPEAKSLADRCRLKICPTRLIRLLKADAEH